MNRSWSGVVVLCAILLALPVTSGAGTLTPGLEVSAGARSTWWFTGDDDDGEEHVGNAIDYFAEPAESWWVGGQLLIGGVPVFGTSIQRPFEDSPEQREIIAATEQTVSTLEDWLIYLDLLFMKQGGPGGWRRFLGGLRLDYRHFLFYGIGEAVEPAVYASRDDGLVVLPVGDTFRMKGEFEDWYLSLFSGRIGSRGVLRFGGYRSVLNKPHESIIDLEETEIGRATLIVETELSGWGGFAQIDHPNVSCLFRMGSVDFEAQGEVPHDLLFVADSSISFLLDLQLTPRIKLVGARDPGQPARLELNPRAGLLFRMDSLNSRTEGLNITDAEDSLDIIIDLGLRLIWRWG